MIMVKVDYVFSLCFLIIGDRDNSLNVLATELKSQRKLVKTLKKKSLWSKTMEEVVFSFLVFKNILYGQF